MDKPLRVALVSMHTNPIAQPGTGDAGGMNVYIHQLALELAALGVEVEIFTRANNAHSASGVSPSGKAENQPKQIAPEQNPPKTAAPKEIVPEQVAPSIRLWQIPAGASDLQKGDLAGVIPDFVANAHSIITEQLASPVHLIHSHYWLSGIAGLELSERLGIPLIHSMHTTGRIKNIHLAPGDTPEPETRLNGEQRIVAQAQGILASANHEKQSLISEYDSNENNIQVVYPGVNLEIFNPQLSQVQVREKLGLMPENRLILFAGRLQKLKAPDVLIKTLPLLPDEVHLIIAGGPSGDATIIPALTALANDLGVQNRVRFLGPLPPDELANWYRAVDVVAVPSYNETFGLVAAEALACGTPVVGTDVGGLREIIHDGVTGLLVSGHSEADWAAAIGRIIGNPMLRSAMSDAAAAQFDRFTWAKTAAQTLAAYHSALS